MLSIRLHGQPFHMMTIQLYPLTIKTKEREVDKFYDQVQFEIERMCKQDMLVVIGN